MSFFDFKNGDRPPFWPPALERFPNAVDLGEKYCNGSLQVLSTVDRRRSLKLKFHGTDTDTDTDILADFRARILERKSVCPACSACHQPDTHDDPRRLVRRLVRHERSLFLARMSVGDARVYTCKRVQYTISYRVPVYKITQ